MAKNKKEVSDREVVIRKYNEIRGIIEQICQEKNLSLEKFYEQFPAKIDENLTEWEIGNLIRRMKKDLSLLMKGVYLEDWKTTIYASFDEKNNQQGMCKMIETTINGNPDETYKYFSKTIDLFKLLNNEETKQCALEYFEEYCATHSFEDVINSYDWVFRSKHAKDVAIVSERGFEKAKYARNRSKGYYAFFNPSNSKRYSQKDTPSEPCNG